jgi:hypothetical protein
MKRNNILYLGRWDDYRGLPEPTVFVEGAYRKEFGKEESDKMDELIAKIKALEIINSSLKKEIEKS